ncbi:hypothetical protein ACPOL_4042 [Acidisarcina polymorpha]|uniref:Uncharacterized protein n=1 Tax=Acidisarcina polymorpha TaxID=2211140 RepID=A0A2Z5G2G9_9BACT|nr:hypothetical protein ACPOL_4042 [Acidisarcina polymorpha]
MGRKFGSCARHRVSPYGVGCSMFGSLRQAVHTCLPTVWS